MLNPYVLPPFGLVGPVLKFFYSCQIPFTIIVQELCLYPYWWTELTALECEFMNFSSHLATRCSLARRCDSALSMEISWG